VDCDEVTFTHSGTRQGAAVAGATFSMLPQGLHHGLPESVADAMRKNWKQHDYYDQKRIAVDSKRRLHITSQAAAAARKVDQVIQAIVEKQKI
jgi:homogentisate 1,2-dioxygenase